MTSATQAFSSIVGLQSFGLDESSYYLMAGGIGLKRASGADIQIKLYFALNIS